MFKADKIISIQLDHLIIFIKAMEGGCVYFYAPGVRFQIIISSLQKRISQKELPAGSDRWYAVASPVGISCLDNIQALGVILLVFPESEFPAEWKPFRIISIV